MLKYIKSFPTLAITPGLLLGALDTVKSAIALSLLQACTNHVLLRASENELAITATNLETTITTTIKIDTLSRGFEAVVPASTLMDTLKLWPKNKTVGMAFDVGNNRLVLLSEDKKQYKMACEEVSEFPLPASVRGNEATNLSPSKLADALAFALPSVARSAKLAPVEGLIGLYFRVKSNCAEACAAQMGFGSGASAGSCKGGNMQILLPVGSSTSLLLLLATASDEVCVRTDGAAAVFTIGQTELHTRLLVHEHPGLDAFFQPEKRTSIDFERLPVLNAIGRLKSYSGLRNGLRLHFKEGNLHLFVKDAEWQREAEEWYPCNMPAGYNKEVNVTLAYLQKLLAPIRSERVQVELGEGIGTLRIFPYVEKGTPTERIVLMPFVPFEIEEKEVAHA